MKNKPYILLLLIAMLSVSLYAHAYDFCVDGLYYKINSDKQTVNLTYGGKYSGKIVVPEKVLNNNKEYTIVGVDMLTFGDCPALISVSLPNSITTLGQSTFSNSTALSQVVLGNGITDIPTRCFCKCSALASLNIPETVETIGESAFWGCSSLTKLVIPASVTKIDRYAFSGCKALTSITFEDSPTTLRIAYGQTSSGSSYTDGNAFVECPLSEVYIGRNLMNYYTSGSIFERHTTLSKVVFGEKVTSIYKGLFNSCSELSEVIIEGNGLKKIGDSSFSHCVKLVEIKGKGLNSVESIGESAFYNCPLKEAFLPNIISIGIQAFYSSSGGSLENVYIGDNLITLPNYCFCGQEKLKKIYLGASLNSIGTNALYKCSSLTNVFLFSDDLISIGEGALPTTISKIFVSNPSRYANLLKDYYCDNLITVNPSNSTYTGNVPSFSFVNNVADTEVEFVPSSLNVNVGEYDVPVQVKFSHGSWNSTIAVKCNYTIAPAPLTVIANNASKSFGTENPPFTCSFFGFKNNETKEVLLKQPVIETTATMTASPGTYPIIPSGAEAQNYTFNYERGTLTIIKADQTIEWNQEFGPVSVGDVIELTATSSSSLPIKYTSTDESIAEVYTQGGKKYVEFLKPGNVSIRATQDGNENYNEADRVSKSFKVDMYVSSVTLSQTSVSLAEGASVQLSASVAPDNATNKTLSWVSNNPDMASVDASGKITALKQGKAIISATTTDGSNITANCEVTVLKLVNGISLNISSVTLSEGQSLQLEASVMPETADNKTLEWTSSNDAIVTVTSEGKIKAIAAGEAVISAKSTDSSNISASCTVSVVKLVTGISLSETEITLNEGSSVKLTATITPANASNKTLSWISSNEAVAKVSHDGTVTALAKGTAVISVKSTDGSNITASCTVTVLKLAASIVLSETAMTLNEGQSAQLTATVLPEMANNKTLRWTSSDESVATVSQDGKITAISKGDAIITASTIDGSNLSASCNVSVIKLVSGIALSESEMTLNEGQTAQLTAIVSEGANNKALKWTSSNESVAYVTQDGKVYAVSKGNAIITATATDGSGVSASCSVTVLKLVSDISLSETEITLKEGQTTQITATVFPDLANNKTLLWSSSNESVAIVSQNGKITAVSKGIAIITATATDGSGVSASCNVTVLKLVSDITLSETDITLAEGQSTQITATISPDLANNKTLLWSSSNESVAVVSQNGKITAVSKGIAVITVKSTDGSNVAASCVVTVVRLVDKITLNESNLTLNEGEKIQLKANVSPDTANNRQLAWTSSDETVVTVDVNGLVTAHQQGFATITASSTDGSNVSVFCEITVVRPVSEVHIIQSQLELVEGEQATLTAYATPSDATNTALRWYSLDESIVTVADGIVTAVGKGTTDIVVESTDGTDIKAVCEVTVTEKSGISSINYDNLKVYVENGAICIVNIPTGRKALIYQENGALIKEIQSVGALLSFRPAFHGVYIVVIGNKSYKVGIR